MSRVDAPAAPLTRCLIVWILASALAWTALQLLGDQLRPPPHADFADLLVVGSAWTLAGCLVWFWAVSSLVVWGAARGASTSYAGCPTWLRRTLLVGCGALLVGAPLSAHADPTAGQPPERVDATEAPTLARTVDDPSLDGVPLPELPATPPEATHAPDAGTPTSPQPSRPPPAESGPPAPEHDPRPPAPSPTGTTRPTPDRSAPPRNSAPTRPPERQPGELVVVRAGDTLWGLAAATLPVGTEAAAVDRAWRELYRLNRDVIGDDPDLIHPGLRLRVDPPQEQR